VNPQVAAGLPYVYFFGSGPSGISTDCLLAFYSLVPTRRSTTRTAPIKTAADAYGDITTGLRPVPWLASAST